ncbi:DNA internalization-related competence protein ComEC/Rec2 [Paenibacillus eucommiae]|uniref:Competence protein ComEC n=1 Tax=Paenibacillus eucommiae TaxID=1355755 RepID=A0ABS4J0N6_9BACL|nr:DNA internalization-related competence protein ComEC/Rec2 [Paenibacillus eucommiae]MBP1992890.1 competence protein ComEC [Paenibacillus eucommiae]
MKRPIVLLVCLWITGNVLALYVSLPWLSLFSSLLFAGAAVLFMVFRLPGRLPVCALLLVLISMGYYEWHDQRNVTVLLPLAQEQELSGSGAGLRGRLAGPVAVDGDRASFALEAESIRFEGKDAFPMRGERVQVSLRLLREEEQALAAGWRRGDALTLQGTLRSPSPARNFGGFDYRRYLRLHRTHWLMTAKGADQVQVETTPLRFSIGQLLRWNDGLRSALDKRMNSIFPGEHAGFMKALLIGLQDDLDAERFQQFSNLGLTHILAISGLNVAVFLGVFIWFMRRLRVTKETYLLLAIALLPCYILITGASPSIVRAGMMAMIALFAARKGLLKDALHLTAIVAWLMLLWNPYYLLDVSFQLSFLVTLGLIVGIPRVNKLLPIASPALKNSLSITIVSQLISFPVSIYYFNQFSLLSWAANMALVPLISMVVFPSGIAALVLGLIYIPFGRSIGWLISGLNDMIFALTAYLQQFRLFQTIWPSPSLLWMAAYYLLFILLYMLLEKRRSSKEADQLMQVSLKPRLLSIGLTLSLASLMLLLWIGYTPERWNQAGTVQFIDVGQGDGILIRTPEGKHILIDGGGTLSFRKPGEEWKDRKNPYEVGRKLLVPILKKRGVHQLDMVILTHQDADHSGGLQAVLEQIPVKQFWFNGTYKSNQAMEQLFRTALERNIPLMSPNQVKTITVDSKTNLQFLYPFPNKEASIRLEKEQNNQSLVFLLHMDGTTWLFTGDMEKTTEANVLESLTMDNTFAPIDVLKVAHHGSKTSSTQEWINYWKPRLAVISVGETNSYGHPSLEVLQRLEQQDMVIYRTDQMGEVQIKVKSGILYERTKLD